MAVCRRHDAPVFGRGGGTSLAGQCCNTAVCFDLSKYMNRVLDIDPERKLGRVQPGTILDDLRRRAQQVGLTFGPDPATHTHCTLGGMTGNDSCGVQPVMAQFPGQGPRTADNVQELDVLTYAQLDALRRKYEHAIRTGFPKIPRRVSGYNLPYLLPESWFNIARALVGPDVFQAADHVTEIMEYRPIGLEGLDDRLVEDMKKAGVHTRHLGLLPEGRGWLLVEFGGNRKLSRTGSADGRASAGRRMDE